MRRYGWLIPVVLAVVVLGRFFLMGAESRRSVPPSTVGGRLADCPPTPNCVSSTAADEEHRIDPLPLAGDPAAALARVTAAADAMPRTRVAEIAGLYRRIEFRSLLFGFVDDLELLAVPETGRIEVRSASRIGYSDLGANRRRVEALAAKLDSSPQTTGENR